MTSTRSTILGGTAALSASTVVTRITSFVSVLLITRGLSLFDYGSLTLALSLAGPAAFLAGLGLETAVTAEVARAIGEGRIGAARRLVRSFTVQKLAAILLLALAAWFLKDSLAARFGSSIADYFFWIALLVAANALSSIVDLLLSAYARFPVVSAMDSAEGIVRLAGVAGVMWFGTLTPAAVLAATLGAKLVAVAVGTPAAWRLFSPWRSVPSEGTGFWGLLRTHGKWGTISQGVIPQIDNVIRPWMVNFFFGPAAVALITLPTNIFSALSILFPIHKVVAPVIARRIGEPQAAAHIAQKATKLNVWVSSALAVAAAALIVPFVRWFFPAYEASIVLFWILIPRLPLLALGSGQDPFFQAFRAQRDLVRYQLVGLFSDVTLLPLLLRAAGVAGIFIERFAALGVLTALRESYLRRSHGIATILPRDFVRFTAEDRELVREAWSTFRHKVSVVGR